MSTQAICVSFLKECLLGIHDLEDDTLKAALYDSNAGHDSDTTEYTTDNEISGTGYTAGGVTLTGVSVSLVDGVVCFDADDLEWPVATFIARSMLIYNSSKDNRSIGVIDFGAEKSAAGNTFRVTLPPALSEKALLRITTYRG